MYIYYIYIYIKLFPLLGKKSRIIISIISIISIIISIINKKKIIFCSNKYKLLFIYNK